MSDVPRSLQSLVSTIQTVVLTADVFQLFIKYITMLGELGRMSCLETRHGAFSTFNRRILRGGYIAWRILRSGTLEGPAGWSFDPSDEGEIATARPPLTLLICPCLSSQRDCCTSSCCHTLRCRSSTVRTLCSHREEWDHDPPTVSTRNLNIGIFTLF